MQVSSYHACLLLSSEKTGNTVANRKKFIRSIRGRIEDDEVMISFDVKALYTSLPVGRVMKGARDKLMADSSLKQRTELEVEDILQLLGYCLTTTFFSF